jgi:hypothetical protein
MRNDDIIFCIPYVWNKIPCGEKFVIHTGIVPYGIWNMDRKPGRKDNIALDEAVVDVWRHHQIGQFYNTFDEWKDCLFRLLSKCPRTTIVLDALDDCMEDDRKLLVELFNSLVSRLPKDSNVKIFVSTRDEIDLSKFLSQHPAILIHKGRTAGDIASVVEAKISQHGEWLYMDPKLQEHILKTLVEDSQDMFLFAQLQIESLRKYSLEGDIRNALKKLPEALTEIYDHMYERATKGYQAKAYVDSVLRRVMCSERPLTTDELLRTIPHDSNLNVATANRQEVDERKIRTLCNHLLRLEASPDDTRPVWRLAHQAVVTYLDTKKLDSFSEGRAVQ